MGKAEEETVAASLAVDFGSDNTLGDASRSRSDAMRGALSLKCIVLVVFGLAVLVSSIFWLPPFVRFADWPDLKLWRSGAQIEGSFKLQKPSSLLRESATIGKLEYDILEEIGVFNTKVVIILLESDSQSNWTNVVFGILPFVQGTSISSAGLSILRASLVDLVIQHSNLHLTPSIFGVPSSFQILKFPGGITIAPPQNAFPLQKVQVPFNFTLNYSIFQIQENFAALKNQLKSGLHLREHEALYVRLTNLNGSTLSPPVIVQASILAEVGLPPPRVRQLANAIANSQAKNLGLNHTVFGKVKQIRLSSYLQHSLKGDGSSSPIPAPAPHHNHHHHHHHHHRDSHTDEVFAPPSQPPMNLVHHESHHAWTPSKCPGSGSDFGHNRDYLAAPRISPSAPVRQQAGPPNPLSDLPEGSPLHAVYFAHVQPPSETAPGPSKVTEGSPPVTGPEDARPIFLANSHYSAPAPAPTPSSATLTIPWILVLGTMLMHV